MKDTILMIACFGGLAFAAGVGIYGAFNNHEGYLFLGFILVAFIGACAARCGPET